MGSEERILGSFAFWFCLHERMCIMSRLYSLATWWFSSLAIALAVLVPLSMPAGALADTGTDGPDGGIQCPNAYNEQGQFIGCASPGAACTCNAKGDPGTCGLTPTGTNCNCNCV